MAYNISKAIVDNLDNDITQFIINNELNPERIYLGNLEWNALKEVARAITGFVYQENTGMEYKNIKIYLVKEDSHIAVY